MEQAAQTPRDIYLLKKEVERLQKYQYIKWSIVVQTIFDLRNEDISFLEILLDNFVCNAVSLKALNRMRMFCMTDVKNAVEQLYALHKKFLELWKSEMFLTWRWWLAVALFILPWVVWIIIRKEESTYRLLFPGLFIILFSLIFDLIGVTLDVWYYPVKIFPILPQSEPFNFSVLPVVTLLFIQYFPKVKAIYKALIYAIAGSFIFQPLMEWIGLYANDEWKNYYSFPILMVMYLTANWLATRKNFKPLA